MTRASTVLYIDARPPSRTLRSALQKAFGAITWVGTLKELSVTLQKESPADWPRLILSELELPDGKVLDWIRDWKLTQPNFPAPWVIVSREFDLETVDSCLKAGFRDLFRKSAWTALEIGKLHHYISNYRRPSMTDNPRAVMEGDIVLDPYMRTVTCRTGSVIQLTPMEFKILASIHQAFPNGLDRHRLFRMLWGDRKVVPKALDVHIFNLRRKLEDFSYQVRSTPNGEFRLSRNIETTAKGESAHEYADPA